MKKLSSHNSLTTVTHYAKPSIVVRQSVASRVRSVSTSMQSAYMPHLYSLYIGGTDNHVRLIPLFLLAMPTSLRLDDKSFSRVHGIEDSRPLNNSELFRRRIEEFVQCGVVEFLHWSRFDRARVPQTCQWCCKVFIGSANEIRLEVV